MSARRWSCWRRGCEPTPSSRGELDFTDEDGGGVATKVSAAEGVAGLDERPGRATRRFPRRDRRGQGAGVRASGESDRALSRSSAAELDREAVTRRIAARLGTAVWRWLLEDAIRPWAGRGSSRTIRTSARRPAAPRLSERRWQGRRLARRRYVISADKKTQLRALLRRHPLVAPAPGRPGLVGTSTAAKGRWPTGRDGRSTIPSAACRPLRGKISDDASTRSWPR